MCTPDQGLVAIVQRASTLMSDTRTAAAWHGSVCGMRVLVLLAGGRHKERVLVVSQLTGAGSSRGAGGHAAGR